MTPQDDANRVETVLGVMEAWSRHDVDQVVAAMADDVVWHYHVGSKPVLGKEHMAKFLSRLAAHQVTVNWKLVQAAVNETSVLLEGTDDYVNPDGNHVRAPYMGVFEFDDDGLISGWRDYVDMANMAIGEKGDDLPPWLQELVDR